MGQKQKKRVRPASVARSQKEEKKIATQSPLNETTHK